MSSPLLYIAGMGMITPLGPSVATTVAAVNAGISAYTLSDYDTAEGEPITMARVPDEVFDNVECEINEREATSFRHERMICMAIIALRAAVAGCTINQSIPLILALPDHNSFGVVPKHIIPALESNVSPWINPPLCRLLVSGRSAGVEAIDFAFKYLHDQSQEYVLIAGVDSFDDESILHTYGRRLLSNTNADAFAPGEGASALLLTSHIELAEVREGYVFALHAPGVAKEEGHMFSQSPYKGDGLDRAFKSALKSQPDKCVHSIYSSMNGENYWAKEYGVAYLRNKQKFIEQVKIEHPSDCYGDLGAATFTTLIGLAAEHLHKTKLAQKHLVYSSSDNAIRGAVVLEKIAINFQKNRSEV